MPCLRVDFRTTPLDRGDLRKRRNYWRATDVPGAVPMKKASLGATALQPPTVLGLRNAGNFTARNLYSKRRRSHCGTCGGKIRRSCAICCESQKHLHCGARWRLVPESTLFFVGDRS